jgi:hypothetical protein
MAEEKWERSDDPPVIQTMSERRTEKEEGEESERERERE